MCWTENYQDEPVGIYNIWVATNIHLDQSSPLRKQWYPLCECPGKRGKRLLNLNLGELRALLEKLCCLVCGRLSRTFWRGWICATNLLSLGLKGHYVGTIVGEETISSFSSAICFCWIKGVEAAMVAMAFCASFEQTVKRLNFAVWEITLGHCFGGTIVGTTFDIL